MQQQVEPTLKREGQSNGKKDNQNGEWNDPVDLQVQSLSVHSNDALNETFDRDKQRYEA